MRQQKNEQNLTRINSKKAKKLFYQGYKIYVLPCNVRIDNSQWIQPSLMDNDIIPFFDDYINQYSYYNCNDKELGLYPSFFYDVNEKIDSEKLQPIRVEIKLSDIF